VSGTSAGWSPARRAAHSVYMAARNRDPEFAAKAASGRRNWSPERIALKRAQMTAQNLDPDFHARKLAGIANRLPRGVRVPKGTHPCVRGFFIQMNAQRATRQGISGRVNVDKATITGWNRSMPRLDTIDAVLNALGLELAIVPIGSRDENGFLKKKAGRPRSCSQPKECDQ
jgi:hypothetical protein